MAMVNSQINRAVWFDIPVADLGRASAFYAAVLGIKVHDVDMGGFKFCVLDHADGNGGCLIPHPGYVAPAGGVLVYLNVDGRLRDAVSKVEPNGGTVQLAHEALGPHGYRAVILDSEGNRIALHSTVDA